jgi:hypothetical protein
MQGTDTYAPYAQMTATVCIARPRAESTGCRPRICALERMIVDGCRRKPESAKEFFAVRNEFKLASNASESLEAMVIDMHTRQPVWRRESPL